jgi:rhodanese-related sulfurtransferase
MTPADLLRRIDGGRAPAVLDVRSRGEFAHGHVPGAVHRPFWRVLFGLDPLPFERREPVVVYCMHRPRAWIAGAALRRRGFRDVAYLDGHKSRWRREGLREER